MRSYKVEVEREARSGETQASVVEGRVMGPYRAESYPVTVEDGDVIVDLG